MVEECRDAQASQRQHQVYYSGNAAAAFVKGKVEPAATTSATTHTSAASKHTNDATAQCQHTSTKSDALYADVK